MIELYGDRNENTALLSEAGKKAAALEVNHSASQPSSTSADTSPFVAATAEKGRTI
jgi:hypothetical protein